MATSPSHRSRARIGWLATTLLLAAGLVAGSWINYRGAVDAVATLNRGQGELVESAVRDHFGRSATPPDSAALQLFMDSFPQFAVAYMAVTDPRGEVLASVGAPTPTTGVGGRERDGYTDLGDRVRVSVHLAGALISWARNRADERRGARDEDADTDTVALVIPPIPEPDQQAEGLVQGRRRGFGSRGPPMPGGGLPALNVAVVEFEPVVATDLVGRASRSLALALASATILTLAALLFWRTSERYAAGRIEMEEQRRLSQLGEMSAVLAHEIRNPLASLKGTAQLLAEGLPEGSRELKRADRIVAEALRLEALTSDLLDFARSGPIFVEPVAPAGLVESAVEEVGQPFEVDAADAPPQWRLDSRRLRHALVNILQNAAQAAPAERVPLVRISGEEDRLLIEIRDFGPGIAEGAVDRIFDPFFTTRTNGTGLGLAVARRAVEMHGGTIRASNAAGGGALFRIELPPAQG